MSRVTSLSNFPPLRSAGKFFLRGGSRTGGRSASTCLLFLALLLPALLFGCNKPQQQVDATRPVHAVTVSLVSDEQEVTYTGDVRARWETALGFRVPGKIVARLVEVGQQVKKGQVLARLDPEDQKLSAEAASSCGKRIGTSLPSVAVQKSASFFPRVRHADF